MWNPCVKKKKKKRPCWEIVTLRGFSSHTSEELATHGAIGLMLGGFFFFFPLSYDCTNLCLMSTEEEWEAHVNKATSCDRFPSMSKCLHKDE